MDQVKEGTRRSCENVNRPKYCVQMENLVFWERKKKE